MKRLLLIVLPLLLMVGCETKISGPIEIIPEVTGVQLKWIGFGRVSGNTQEVVWYVGNKPSFPDNLLDDDVNYGWDISYKCDEIELFQSEGYFNFIFWSSEPNVKTTLSFDGYYDMVWEE